MQIVSVAQMRLTSFDHSSLIHVTDWLPTLYTAAGGDVADLPEDIDGVNQWPSLANARVPSNRKGRNWQGRFGNIDYFDLRNQILQISTHLMLIFLIGL